MFTMKKSNTPLILSIIFATFAITGSVIFLGLQMGKTPQAPSVEIGSQDAIEKGIESYIAKQEKAQRDAQKNQKKDAAEKAKNVAPVNEKDHIRGKKDATITLIEYSDFECPFCKKFHPTAQEFLTKNSEKVNWVYRHFPLGFHDPLATNEAEASECAAELGGNDSFWAYTDKVYEKTRSNGRGLKESDLVDIATEIGLDKNAFITCQESDTYLSHIQQDIQDGRRAGITGTPGNILRNNKTGEVRFIPGAFPLSELERAMNELL